MPERLGFAREATLRRRLPSSAERGELRGVVVYYVFWYGIRNSELNDFGEALEQEENPLRVSVFLAIVAITVGGLLIVPPFVSQWRFYRRIGRAQELVGLEDRISHGAGILLFLIAFFLLPFEIPYAQHHLNRLWEREASEEQKRSLGAATA